MDDGLPYVCKHWNWNLQQQRRVNAVEESKLLKGRLKFNWLDEVLGKAAKMDVKPRLQRGGAPRVLR